MNKVFLIGTLSPWFVIVLFLVIVLVAILELPNLLKAFWKTSLVAKIIFFGALIAGTLIRLDWVPNSDRIYFDEDRYLSYAVAFARHNKNLSIDIASPENLISGEPDIVARVTVPVLNGLVLKIFGYSKDALYNTAKIFSSAQIILIFTGLYLLFKEERAASIAALLFALSPIPIYWATSTALDSYFVFFSLLAFTAACWYAREPKILSALFLISTTVVLLFVRFEALLFLFVIVAAIFSIRRSEGKLPITKTDIRFALLALPIVGVRILVSLSVLGETWCCGEATPLEAFSVSYFIRNTLPNLLSLFDRLEFPFILTVLAITALFGKRDSRILPLGLWAFFFFFIYSFYFAGMFFTYQFSGSYGRYLLMLVPPLVMLASLTLSSIFDGFKQANLKKRFILSTLIVLFAASLIPTAVKFRTLIYRSPYDAIVDRGPRRNQDFLVNVVIPQTPGNSIIIHPLSGLVLLSGRTAVYFESFFDDEEIIDYVVGQVKQGVPAFMLHTQMCDFFPEKCEKVLPYFAFTPYPLREETPSGFALAKLELKGELESTGFD